MYPVPFNEQKRLEVLNRYGIVDTPSDPAYDDLTSLACRQFSIPIALVSLVDSDRQWFKSHAGLDASETPRDLAFCAHAILKSEPLIVNDTMADPRFSDNALVMGEPHIRFYAGAPLVTAEGFRLGTFCLIDTVPRPDFTADDRRALEEFARLTMQLLEKRRAEVAKSSAQVETDLADDARKDLFGLVAHEIRSPIATLISLARVIDERVFGPLSDESYSEFLSDLTRTAERVGEITDRMLDFARLGTGEIDLQEETVLLPDLLETVRLATQGQALPKNLSVEFETQSGANALYIDGTLSNQMLINLVSNAMKFSPEGGTVSVVAVDCPSGEVDIRVTDSGPGPGDAAIERNTAPEGDVGEPRPTESGGTGFGLPLVRRLIELHGGRVFLEHGERVGTVATLRFPTYRVLAPSEVRSQVG